MRRRTILLLLAAVSLLLAAGVAWAWLTRSGLPQRSGEAPLPELSDAVEVRWNSSAVPHVRATTLADAAAAMGWLHANDRLVQMEFGRRMAAGRLAEVAGAAALPLDRYFTALGFPQLQEQAAAALGESSRQLLEAYASGVNAWIDARGSDLPPELRLLGVRPAPWRVVDSMAFLLHMQHELSFWNARPEEARFQALRALGVEALAELIGAADLYVHPEIAAMAAAAQAEGPAAAATPWPGAAAGGAPGSNNWALSGAWTASRTPIVANDPHLPLRLPGIWYQASIRAPGYEAAGMTLPGFPFIVLGQSARMAWAMTNVMLDDHDVFFEQLDAQGTRVRRGEAWLPLRERRESIHIAGGDSEELTVRFTDLGVLLEADPERGLPPRSLAWTAGAGGDPASLFLALARAGSVRELIGRLEAHVAPAQNLVVADRDGGLLYTAVGRAPDRFGDGRLPLPGWDLSTHWRGLKLQADNPTALDPATGMLVTANHDIRDLDEDGRDPEFRADFDTGHRAIRIESLLHARRDWSPAQLASVQTDQRSEYAREVVPLLLRQAGAAAPPTLVAALESWDGTMATSGPATLFALIEREVMRGVFGDEAALAGAPGLADRDALLRLLRGEMARPWYDDVATPGLKESASATLSAAMERAWEAGVELWGPEVEGWQWGELHALTLRNAAGGLPLLGRWFDRGPLATGGSATTVAAFGGGWQGDTAPVAYGPSMRWISDVASPDGSLAILVAGQSGHPWDPHYADQLEDYLAGRLRAVRFSEKAIAASTTQTLVLR